MSSTTFLPTCCRNSSTAAASADGQCRDRDGCSQPRLRPGDAWTSSSTRSTASKRELLYLDCSGTELMRRYDETRRRHPLAPDRPAEDGIARERQLTWPLQDRSRQPARHDGPVAGRAARRASAALRRRFRPAGADHRLLLLRTRHFADRRPGVRPALPAQPALGRRASPADRRRSAGPRLSGQDPSWGETMGRIESLLIDWIPRYWAAGKSYVTVAFGCTGGRHRSVAAAVEMAERLRLPDLHPTCVTVISPQPRGTRSNAHPGRAPESEDELNR